MEGCKWKCGSSDHFHQVTSDNHLCGNEHTCQALCEEKGMCEIVTELVKKQTFCGQRSSFEFEHMSEQNGKKKDCCIPIPPWEEQHEGPHRHTLNPDVVHLCDVRCPLCGYFCHHPKGHAGLHDTAHGNMRNVHFASESPEIDILDSKYAWGESGMAEMCQIHCKARGRGHIHLRKCLQNEPFGKCAGEWYDEAEARHERKQCGPDFDGPKDEYTHKAYWELLNFKDPCQEEDIIQFELCNHFCPSKEHEQQSGAVGRDGNLDSAGGRIFCTRPLWHNPQMQVTLGARTRGYISRDGHIFTCQHADLKPHHVVFVIDRSTSMGAADMKPVSAQVALRHNNRLGCVYEAVARFTKSGCADIVSVVVFNHTALLIVDKMTLQECNVRMMQVLLRFVTESGTRYSTSLERAQMLLQPLKPKVACSKAGVVRNQLEADESPNYLPAVNFLSDGVNSSHDKDPVPVIARMKEAEPRLVLHTLLFGRQNDVVKRP